MSLPRLVPCPPVGKRTAPALVQRMGPRGRECSFEMVTLDEYLPGPEAVELRRVRVEELNLGLREAAARLRLSPPDLSHLERGSARFADPAGWAAALELLRAPAAL